MAKRQFHFRAFVSLFLLISALVITVTGVVLYLSPPGRIANWTGWMILGLTKTQWQGIHTVFALLFVVAVGIHTYLNWRVILSYLYDRVRGGVRRGRELALACFAIVLVFGLTLGNLPPFSMVLDLGNRLSFAWDEPESRLPIPPNAEVGEVGPGGRAGMEPPARAGEGGMRTGWGRLTVDAFCAQEGIPVAEALARLRAAGIDARAGHHIRDLADESGHEPGEIVRIIVGP